MKCFTQIRCTQHHRFFLFVLFVFTLSFGLKAQDAVRKNVESLRSSGVHFSSFTPFLNDVDKSATALSAYDVVPGTLAEAIVLMPAVTESDLLKANQPEFISLDMPGFDNENLTLHLYKSAFLSEDYVINDSEGSDFSGLVESHAFYRGVVAGKEKSLVALSVIGNEIRAIISYGEVTLVLGKLKEAKNNAHVLYVDNMLGIEGGFECSAIESDDYVIPESDIQAAAKTIKCVRIRAELDNGLVSSLGGSINAVNYTLALWNEVLTLYANDDIDVVLSDIFAWVVTSPYTGSLGNRLDQLSNNTPGADLTTLLTNTSFGGIAYLSGLCSSNFGVSVSGIYGFYNNVPSYSWDVNVCAHEIGHNLSSPHTHACAWNGNNTAIDGCGPAAGYSEGCSALVPSGGGTVMSYCHLLGTGMNFNLGFGPQPTTRMTNYINSRTCLGTNCSGITAPVCDEEELVLNIITDNYPGETTWDVRDEQNNVMASGGNYQGAGSGASITEYICVTAGCYTFTMYDSYGDGICCAFGNGSYNLTSGGITLVSGGAFLSSVTTAFCAGEITPSVCDIIDFNSFSINTYGGNRDIGTFQILDGGATIFLQNNALKSINLNYTVTPNTVLEFKFRSTSQAQVHGIGFNSNSNLVLNKIFKVHGTLNNNQIIDDYDFYFGSSYLTFVIEVGAYYSGSNLSKLFFLTGNAVGAAAGNSYYKDVKVYENGACQVSGNVALASAELAQNTHRDNFAVFPNPATTEVQIRALGLASVESVKLFSATGAMIQSQTVNSTIINLDLSGISTGVYILEWIDTDGNQFREKLIKSK